MNGPPLPYGLILAGGHGRRMADMAGPPKPLVMLAGQPLLAHVVGRLRPQVRALALNTNDSPALFASFGLPLRADTVADRPGPLAGVLAGLEWLALESVDAPLLTVPADTPFLPADLAARLGERHAKTGGVVCAASAGRTHHVVALWPQSARAPLAEALAAGQRKVGLLLSTLGAVTESWDTANGDPFFNVNTPEDLAAAESRSPASR
ncbi:molybdenum cofactor guanylyltransferase MobA [Xanthobacter sp. V4C-4]|uniref:molybdenum cofactor guanylyltransferase MobA n=1 Tax=Xanthobacter cornucopiae TaxID=3119924 RepID=UPI00372BC7BD